MGKKISEEQIFELKCIRGNLIKERDEFLESIKKYELETTFDTNF